MARHQKKARRQKRTIVLIDETGFMLQPVVRRTWALRGHTPIHKCSARHDRVSGIGAITVSSLRGRVGLYFRLQDANFRWPAVVSFIRMLRRHVGRKLLIVWDRLNVHRSAQRELRRFYGNEIVFHWLPSYAPELNPVEQVWSHTKFADLANNLPQDATELWKDVYGSLTPKRRDQTLLKAFFRHAKLPL